MAITLVNGHYLSDAGGFSHEVAPPEPPTGPGYDHPAPIGGAVGNVAPLDTNMIAQSVADGSLTPTDAMMISGSNAGVGAGNAYRAGIQGIAPGANLNMENQFNHGYQVDQGIHTATTSMAPQQQHAVMSQNEALGNLYRTSVGSGPSVAALQQQQGLNDSYAGANTMGAQNHAGMSQAAITNSMLNANGRGSSQAVNAGSAGKLGEMFGANSALTPAAGQYAANQTQSGNLAVKGATDYASLLNDTTALRGGQRLGTQNASTAYMAGLANQAEGGQSNVLQHDAENAQMNGALLNAGASAASTYLAGQQDK